VGTSAVGEFASCAKLGISPSTAGLVLARTEIPIWLRRRKEGHAASSRVELRIKTYE
jgi:hypothetical protein